MTPVVSTLLTAALGGGAELSSETVRIPFGQVDRRVSMAALVDGRGPYHFMLDTGASGQGRIDVRLAERLGLPRAGRVLQDDGTGINRVVRHEVAIAELELGGATFRDVVFTASEYDWVAGEDELEVSGLLGIGLFEDLLLTVDYPAYVVRLSRELAAGADHTLRYDGHLGLCSIEVALGEFRFPATIDTGSAGGLLLPEAHRDRVRTRGASPWTGRGRLANNAFTVRGARLRDSLQLAGHRLTRVEAGFVDLELRANLGYAVLREFALTLDQRNRLVRFARDGSEGD